MTYPHSFHPFQKTIPPTSKDAGGILQFINLFNYLAAGAGVATSTMRPSTFGSTLSNVLM